MEVICPGEGAKDAEASQNSRYPSIYSVFSFSSPWNKLKDMFKRKMESAHESETN